MANEQNRLELYEREVVARERQAEALERIDQGLGKGIMKLI